MAALPRKWVSDGAPTLGYTEARFVFWEGPSSGMPHFSAAKRRFPKMKENAH
jgi:hypothetical protein